MEIVIIHFQSLHRFSALRLPWVGWAPAFPAKDDANTSFAVFQNSLAGYSSRNQLAAIARTPYHRASPSPEEDAR